MLANYFYLKRLPELSETVSLNQGTMIGQSCIIYSETSDRGPSEIGTVYNRPLYKGHCLRFQTFILLILTTS